MEEKEFYSTINKKLNRIKVKWFAMGVLLATLIAVILRR